MKPQPTSKKTLIVAIVAILVLVLVYFYFSGGAPADTGSALQAQSASVVGTRVLSLLNQIKSLHIDTRLFDATAYKTLVDYSVEIPQTSVGRPNPFAPIPGMPVAPATPNTTR
jgi:hypothetical protein